LDWKLTNVLPKAGGTLDQSPEFMRDLRAISAAEGNFEKIKADKQAIKARIETLTKGK
jgi:hypothetical protein